MTSYYLVQNINHFGSLGGFDALLRVAHLSSQTQGATPLDIAKIFEPLVRIRAVMEAHILKQTLNSCMKAAKMWLANIGAEDVLSKLNFSLKRQTTIGSSKTS